MNEDNIIKEWEHNGRKCRITKMMNLENDESWYCGYVETILDMTRGDLDDMVDIHGGLTYPVGFNDYVDGWVGFDCCHASDMCIDEDGNVMRLARTIKQDVVRWTPKKVEDEVEKLVEQIDRVESMGSCDECGHKEPVMVINEDEDKVLCVECSDDFEPKKDEDGEVFHKLKKKKLKAKSPEPFENSWADFIYEDEETGEVNVVTIKTMRDTLEGLWDNFRFGFLEFSQENLLMPGVYRDDMLYGDSGKDNYTIVLSIFGNFLPREMCEKRIEELNRTFCERFELDVEDDGND